MTRNNFNSEKNQKRRQELCAALRRWISVNKLNQRQAAKILGIHPPQISYICTGRIAGFSIDRLMYYCERAGIKLKLSISNAKRR